ncbi:Ti-type conjugative transfer relaxase TraA [Novosphingobium fluoreni]|uniref:Ti-type conjugative transfer relaxase TraA n=1 Tax=Novosphingobium fluoreni TaxID=1391222 RepID=A0A7W6FY88_9SPHN|nr:Ti-type conjugative transfer relaxase TraA [Novosphingobium fluoreni]MBB3938897.1 Ti-type conjugative transfer relaxase TraA [Novosphingobium fluoreni]
MAIYHFSAKVISRASGSSAVAAAAYRSASRLHDQRLDRAHDFSNKAGVVHSEVMLPDGAPERWQDREVLWNDVEAVEVRKDAQLAREIEFALPRELDQADGIRLARDFVAREFVDRGMVADLNVHWDIGEDGLPKPHAHVMLGLRQVTDEGFGPKVREWNKIELLTHWREAWAEHVNARLAELDIDARVDHRSLEAQGIELEPQHKIGPAASRMAGQGLESERLDEHHAIARENGARILAKPTIALDAITQQQATFTTRDLARFVHRHSEGKDQFDQVLAAVRASPELVSLGKDGRGEDRFTSRGMIETERRLESATIRLDATRNHGVDERHIERALARAQSRDMVLSPEQRGALEHATSSRGLTSVVGYAGTGKSAMLGVAREAWEQAGYDVRGLALSGIAAENLESGSGIASRTIASMEQQWSQQRELLTNRSVLVIDEAGMIGTRQMERMLAEAEKRQAKVVLVGDPEQLQAIEAGAAFRSIAERHGAIEITQVRRQREDWQRDATRHLATGRTGEALAAYEQAGHVHAADTRDAARTNLIARWDTDRQANPNASHIILTHTNDEVQALNQAARARLRAADQLGKEVTLGVERGSRDFAEGDRVMFLKNERSLGVKNGSLGTIRSVSPISMAVMLDDGRAVAFDLKEYNQIDHGYAATIHKAQGMTVDKVHVLATPGLDRHGAYVALSRHRDQVDLHYGADDFADRDRLVRTLGRERCKDMVADYTQAASHQPQLRSAERRKAAPAPVRDPFAGLDLRPLSTPPTRGVFDALDLPTSPTPRLPAPISLNTAVQRFARATADIMRMRKDGYTELPHHRLAYDKAAAGLDVARPDAARDLRAAFARDRELISAAAAGRTDAAIRAMVLEAELKVSPERRADRFLEDWQKLAKAHRSMRQAGDQRGVAAIEKQMTGMAKSMGRDAQAESLVRKRLPGLGIEARAGASLSHTVQDWLGLSRGRGLGR